MTPKILTLIAYLAAAAGIVLELCGVPGAGLVLGTVAGWLGARRPGDPSPELVRDQIEAGVRAGLDVLGPVLEQLEPSPTFPDASPERAGAAAAEHMREEFKAAIERAGRDGRPTL